MKINLHGSLSSSAYLYGAQGTEPGSQTVEGEIFFVFKTKKQAWNSGCLAISRLVLTEEEQWVKLLHGEKKMNLDSRPLTTLLSWRSFAPLFGVLTVSQLTGPTPSTLLGNCKKGSKVDGEGCFPTWLFCPWRQGRDKHCGEERKRKAEPEARGGGYREHFPACMRSWAPARYGGTHL